MSCTFHSNARIFLSEEEKKKRRCLEILGGVAEDHAFDYCPYRTGNLRNSITHQQLDENTELIGSNVEYAPYVCLGTSKMRAQPFLRPAIENHRSEYRAIIEAELHS